MIEITADFALSAMREAVAKMPEGYIYVNRMGQQAAADEYGVPLTGCDYFVEEEPSCLVGHVLFKAGISKQTLWEISAESWYADSLLVELRENRNIGIDDRVIDALNYAQKLQDRGHPWRDVLKRTEKTLSL